MNIQSPFLAGSSRFAQALNADPSGFTTGIGYANRIESQGSALGDLFANIGLPGVGDVVDNTFDPIVNSLIGSAQRRALEALGYQFLETVEITYNGARVSGVKAKKPDGTFVVVLSNGTQVPFSSAVQATTQAVNPDTGMSTGTVAMGVGAVAVGGLLLYLLLKKR